MHIYGVGRKAGLTDAEAQDVVQDTLHSIAKHMPTFKYDPAIGSFKAWLLIKSRWCIIDQFRKRGPVAPFQPLPGDTTSDLVEKVIDSAAGQVLEALWEAEWERNLAEAAIAKAKPGHDPQQWQIFDF